MRKRPKSVGLSPQLAAFLATPVRLPPANTPLERLSEDCKRIVDELLRQASVDKILPSATLGVVYLSLEPKSGALALRSHLLWWGGDDAGRLRALAGYAYAAHFNRKARSFFQRIPRSKRSRTGWMALFSSDMGKSLLLPEVNSIHFDLRIQAPGNFRFLDGVAFKLAEIEDLQVPREPRIYDFGRLVSDNAIVFNTPPSVANAQYTVREYSEMGTNENSTSKSPEWLDKETFNEFVYEYSPERENNRPYFDHIVAGIQDSHYLLCAPEQLSFQPHSTEDNPNQIHTGAETGVGFILDRATAIDEESLRSCFWIAHKLGMVSPLRWVTEVKVKPELEREKLDVAMKMVETFRHEFNNTYANVQARLGKAERDNVVAKSVFDDIDGRLGLMSAAIDGLDSSFNLKQRELLSTQLEKLQTWTSKWQDFVLLATNAIPKEVISRIQVPKAFRLILSELTRNAYKYNPESLPESEPRRAKLKLSSDATNVFIVMENLADESRFHKLQRTLTHKSLSDKPASDETTEPYTMIGVQLCKFLIEKMNGQFHCSFDSGKLSVTITIPVSH